MQSSKFERRNKASEDDVNWDICDGSFKPSRRIGTGSSRGRSVKLV